MIVVDASALVAIGDGEAEAEIYLAVIERAARALISPINAVEAGVVLIGRQRFADAEDFDLWLESLAVEVDKSPGDHAGAMAAYLAFGRGYNPARLNLGDSFAYALAKKFDAPLLYKGDDFAQTDIRSALQPT